MRLRLRIELQNDAQVALGTITWIPAGGQFSTAEDISRAFHGLRSLLPSAELERRVAMLRTLADAEIAVTAPPNIQITS